MTRYAIYRFPALQDASARSEARRADPAVADGYDAGHEIGYADGRRTGHADGRREGLAEGLAQGREAGERAAHEAFGLRFAEVFRMLDSAAAAMHSIHADYRRARRDELIDLVAKVTRQVIRCELALQPQQLLKLIDGALSALPATDDAPEVHLSPEDCARLAELGHTQAQGWCLISDRALHAGECRVRAGGQEVDAGCAHRLHACLEQLRDVDDKTSEDAPEQAHGTARPTDDGAAALARQAGANDD